MIYIYQILKQRRKQLEYSAKALYTRLEVTKETFIKMESELTNLPPDLLTNWLKHLDIRTQEDIDYFQQKHTREIFMYKLEHVDPRLPDPLLKALADLLSFRSELVADQLAPIVANITALVLPHILSAPRIYSIIVEELENAASRRRNQ